MVNECDEDSRGPKASTGVEMLSLDGRGKSSDATAGKLSVSEPSAVTRYSAARDPSVCQLVRFIILLSK